MTEDTARVIATKIEELGGIFKAYSILDISPSRINEPTHFRVQVKGMNNVPNTDNVTYRKRQDTEYSYEKTAVVYGVKFIAIGTIEDIQKEFKQEA